MYAQTVSWGLFVFDSISPMSPDLLFRQQSGHFVTSWSVSRAASMSDSDDGSGLFSGVERPLRMYVIRHEKRPPEDPTFFVSLTPEGMADAESVVCETLDEIGVTAIYASPFKRVLQTVQPYHSGSEFMQAAGGIKVDWSLYEHPEPNPTPVSTIPDEFLEEFDIDGSYKSYIDPTKAHSMNHSVEDVQQRLQNFVEFLSKLHEDGEVVLLATHQTSVHALLSMASGIPMDCFDVPMGKVIELDWHGVIKAKYHGGPNPPWPCYESHFHPNKALTGGELKWTYMGDESD